MSYEIVRTVNGYIVHPTQSYKNQGMCMDYIMDVYVFNDYQKMVDKLFELLNPNSNILDPKASKQ